jgi:hypothetical protein
MAGLSEVEESVWEDIPCRPQVSLGRNCPWSSRPVYVFQNCVLRTRPPKVSTQQESTFDGSWLGHDSNGFCSWHVWFNVLWPGYICAWDVLMNRAAAPAVVKEVRILR